MATKKLEKGSSTKAKTGQAKKAGDLGEKEGPEAALSEKDSAGGKGKKTQKPKKSGFVPFAKKGAR